MEREKLAENERRRSAHKKRTDQYEALRAECDQLDNLQRSGTQLSPAQHRRMAQLLAALSEDEDAPEWAIVRAQQAQAHAALAALTT